MTDVLSLQSPAKINLTLDILGRDPSGYHRILTIFHEVQNLFDELTFEETDTSEIEILCNHPEITLNESNTIHKAVALLKKHHSTPEKNDRGLRITLQKNIPIGSGLGGGSSNAAVTLKALNILWNLQLTQAQLLTYAAQIGMDVPFFILGGAALGMHYGEHLMPLPPLEGLEIEVLFTDIFRETQEAYQSLSLEQCGRQESKTHELVHILKGEKEASLQTIESLLHNDFEASFFAKYPEVRKNYPNAHLAGSGGALFKIIKKSEDVETTCIGLLS